MFVLQQKSLLIVKKTFNAMLVCVSVCVQYVCSPVDQSATEVIMT
jgi:hypothetical protein